MKKPVCVVKSLHIELPEVGGMNMYFTGTKPRGTLPCSMTCCRSCSYASEIVVRWRGVLADAQHCNRCQVYFRCKINSLSVDFGANFYEGL